MNDLLPPGPGHNLSLPSPEIIISFLTDTEQTLMKRAADLLSAFERVPKSIETEDIAERAADMVKKLRTCIREADARRLGAGAPVRAVEAAINAYFNKNVIEPLDKCRVEVLRRATAYQTRKDDEERERRENEAREQRERERKAREEAAAAAARVKTEADLGKAITAERVADQASLDTHKAEQAAQAKPADLSRTRGTLGGLLSLRTFWDYKDVDRTTLDLEALRHHLSLECLEKAIRSYIKAGGRDLSGATIFQNRESR